MNQRRSYEPLSRFQRHRIGMTRVESQGPERRGQRARRGAVSGVAVEHPGASLCRATMRCVPLDKPLTLLQASAPRSAQSDGHAWCRAVGT